MIHIGLTAGVDPGLSNSVMPSFGELHLFYPQQPEPVTEWEAKIDELWAANRTTTDQEARAEYVQEVQRIWLENIPVLYLFQVLLVEAYGNEYGNIYPQSPNGFAWQGILDRMYVK